MSNTSDASLLGKIANYTEILAKDPKSTVFVQLAETYRRMGLMDDALEVVEKGIRSQPGHAPGYVALGRVQAERKAFAEAESAFERALEMDKGSLAAMRGLTRLRLRAGKKDSARELLGKILEIKPDDQGARELLGKLKMAPTHPEASEATPPTPAPEAAPPTRPQARKGDPISTPTIAEIYIRQGFPKRAMKVYRDLLQADPQNEEIRRKLVDLKELIAREDNPADEPAAPREEPTPVETPQAQQPAIQKAETAEPEEQETGQSAGERALETFDSWLQSIRRRREHVR